MTDTKTNKAVILSLKKSLGTIQKVIDMIEQDKYCVDIATQINASIGLLKSANSKLLENHLACCGPKFLTATESDQKEAFIQELLRTRQVTSR